MGEGFLDDSPTHHTPKECCPSSPAGLTSTSFQHRSRHSTGNVPCLPARASLSPSRGERVIRPHQPLRIAQFETYTQKNRDARHRMERVCRYGV